MFPSAVLTASLKALSEVYPCLQVTVFTEAMGGAEQRLRDGAAKLAFCVPFPGRDRQSRVRVPGHDPDGAGGGVESSAGSAPRRRSPRADLEKEVQLVLTDRTTVSNGLSGGIVSFRTWRFADLATRLEFLLGGFGWCNMPLHLVRDHVDIRRAQGARRCRADDHRASTSTSSTSGAVRRARPAAG